MSTERILSSHQIKAARALLDWSQDDLANSARLSIATIRKLELGHISPRHTTTRLIRQTMEKAGIEFIESDGIRRRLEEINIFKGVDGIKDFFDDITASLKNHRSDIVMVTYSIEDMNKICGVDDFPQLEILLKKDEGFTIKCLLTEAEEPQLSTPRLEFRTISRQYVDAVSFCVYGDKYALFQIDNDIYQKIIVMRSRSIAESFRRQFHSMWEKAMLTYAALMGGTKKAV